MNLLADMARIGLAIMGDVETEGEQQASQLGWGPMSLAVIIICLQLESLRMTV